MENDNKQVKKPNNIKEDNKNNIKVDKKEKTDTIKKKKAVNKTSEKKVKKVDISELNKKISTELKKNKTKKVSIEEEKKFSLFEVILLIIITILSCILIGSLFPKKQSKSYISQKDEYLQEIIDQYNYILDNYYGDIDKELLIKNTITGMLSSLDEYSQMIDEVSNTFSITLQGEYEGLGIVIYNDENYNIILQEVYANTPAAKANLKAGDRILKIGNLELKNVATSDFVNMINMTDDISLTILRDDTEFVVNLKKEKIVLNSVNSKIINNDIGYIDIDIFAANTYSQFKSVLDSLESNNINKLIIDLRDNTGGHLDAVQNMLGLFFDKSHVIYQLEDKNGIEKVYSNGNKNKNFKIVILQNGNSASASEIMTSTLKEEANAYIIGTKSYGKGTVQQLIGLDNTWQYKFTTKRWLTPTGNWINNIGIAPDLEIMLTNEYYNNPCDELDNQLQLALQYLK